ncbi:unnamed protein product [Rotaria sordida]|uniref:Uncharacterized protein n=1 Tax=Rotaria sordida TaxID=392033 RepID=A0A818KW33_9BILA|nr:unnamed protein product [Rotaria sordida]CAF3842673.1 unnamed protein product [Rotaria sordida]
MFKSDENPVSNETSNAQSNETKSAIPPHIGELDMPPAIRHRLAWKALKKTINDQVKKVNKSNVPKIARKLFKYNIIRGRGLLTDAIIKEQITSPSNAPVYAALILLLTQNSHKSLNELIAIQLLRVVLDNYTDDSVELAVEWLKECGEKLLQDNHQELDSIFVILENLLHEPSLN